jgi:hypothetical protein
MLQVQQAMTTQVHWPKVMGVQRLPALGKQGASAVEQSRQVQPLKVRQIQQPRQPQVKGLQAQEELGAVAAKQALRLSLAQTLR